MSSTKTAVHVVESALDEANPNQLPDILNKMDMGRMFTPRKVTFSGMTSAAAQDITTLANFAKATPVPAFPVSALDAPLTLPPILTVITLRVTAGAAQAGPRVVTDSGGTAAAGATGLGGAGGGVAVLSDDGKTLTFEAAVTGFVLEYIPRPAVDMTAKLES